MKHGRLSTQRGPNLMANPPPNNTKTGTKAAPSRVSSAAKKNAPTPECGRGLQGGEVQHGQAVVTPDEQVAPQHVDLVDGPRQALLEDEKKPDFGGKKKRKEILAPEQLHGLK